MNSALEKIAKVIGGISTVGGYIAGGLCLVLLGLTLAEIFVRTFLSMSLLFTLEVAGWLLVAMTFLGAAWTLKEGGHIRVTLVSSHLSQRAQHWTLLGIASLSLVFLGWFCIFAWQNLIVNYVGQIEGWSPHYHLLLWWVWLPLCVGTVLLILQFVGVMFQSVLALKRLGRERTLTSVALAFLVSAILGIGIWICALPTISGLGWVVVLVIGIVLLFILVASSLWTAIALAITGMILFSLFTVYPVETMVPRLVFSANANFILVAIPLFIFMGELLRQSGSTHMLYSGLSRWVERIPGRLLHSNILACTIFAAISGSSAATAATVSSVAVPELKRRGYDRNLVIGSLAGAGTLGLLIPPSLAAILYGALTNTSVGQLFIAGVIPGLMISGLFMAYIGVVAIHWPSVAPPSQRYTWEQRLWGLVQIVPIALVVVVVLGLIYLGISTPTEAAAIGSLCAIVITAAYRRLNWTCLRQALLQTIRITCMIMFIIMGAAILSSVMAYTMIPQHLAKTIVGMNISRYAVFAVICFIYILLGCLFEANSMMVLTLPIIFPLIVALGFDPIWFGVVLIILIEVAQVTPPIGINLFVLENITGQPITTIAKNALPFFAILLSGIIIITFFPIIALWLPCLMIR